MVRAARQAGQGPRATGSHQQKHFVTSACVGAGSSAGASPASAQAAAADEAVAAGTSCGASAVEATAGRARSGSVAGSWLRATLL